MQAPTLVQGDNVDQVEQSFARTFRCKQTARVLRGRMFDFNVRACDASLSAAWRFVQTAPCNAPPTLFFVELLGRCSVTHVGNFVPSLNKRDGWQNDLELMRHNLPGRHCHF